MINFVGAGPGAVDLITVRGLRLLESADVIIYAGSLVNKTLLDNAKEDCEIYNSAEMTLEQVIEVMVTAHGQNKGIVRLHTGDPSIYGAIREQMDLLTERNIEFRQVPGVSSMNGAAAALKAEYTLPDVTQTVILTRMEGRTPVPAKEDISELAKIQASMVIFLSTSMLGKLAEKLKVGYGGSTPCAIVYKATWEDEKVVRTTIDQFEESAAKAGITKTALILVGDFLGDKYARSLLYHPKFSHEFRNAEEKI